MAKNLKKLLKSGELKVLDLFPEENKVVFLVNKCERAVVFADGSQYDCFERIYLYRLNDPRYETRHIGADFKKDVYAGMCSAIFSLFN